MIRQETPVSDTIGSPVGSPVYTVYRYYNKRGVLLYVGYTSTRAARSIQHWRNAPWWPDVASATFRHYQTAKRALRAEVRAIENEYPLHNKQHTGRGRGWTAGSLENLGYWFEDHPDERVLRPEDLEVIVGIQAKLIGPLIVARGLPHLKIGTIIRVYTEDAEEVVIGLTDRSPVEPA